MSKRYENLKSPDKKYIERRIVSLILGKNSHHTLCTNCACIKNTSGTQLRIIIPTGIKFWGHNNKKELVCDIRMKTLPERAALLLAITHRPLFEAYKKYLEEAK